MKYSKTFWCLSNFFLHYLKRILIINRASGSVANIINHTINKTKEFSFYRNMKIKEFPNKIKEFPNKIKEFSNQNKIKEFPPSQ